jgi:hypothetical protein
MDAFITSTTSSKWTIAGDFNMIKIPHDSTSTPPMICGSELEEWRLLKMKLSLKDAVQVKQITWPIHTRRGSPNDNIVQSRLDQVYFSDWEIRINKLTELRHHNMSTLSDHNLVLVKITISVGSNLVRNCLRKSHFKANPGILRK